MWKNLQTSGEKIKIKVFSLCNKVKLINFYSFPLRAFGFIMFVCYSCKHINFPLAAAGVCCCYLCWIFRWVFLFILNKKLNYYSLKILISRHILLLKFFPLAGCVLFTVFNCEKEKKKMLIMRAEGDFTIMPTFSSSPFIFEAS